MAEAKVKISKKGNKDKVPAGKIGKGKKPVMSDVEAQGRSWQAVACWNCWAINDVVVDSNVWMGYYCWNCGAYFEV
jgi:hypothetical protein